MLRNNYRLVLAAVAALAAAPSFAATGLYLGAGAGRVDNNAIDDTDTGYKAFFGYNFTDYLGVEGGYVNLGSYDVGPANVDVDGLNLVGVLTLPFTPQFGAFAKGGAAWTETRAEVGGLSADDQNTDATYGAGVKFDFNDMFGVRGEWERFELDRQEADLLSASAVFRFY